MLSSSMCNFVAIIGVLLIALTGCANSKKSNDDDNKNTNSYDNIFEHLWHGAVKVLPESVTNKTKHFVSGAKAEAQYCLDKIAFNRKVAELTSSKTIFSMENLKSSYNLTKEYFRLKKTGKNLTLCSNQSALSLKTAVGASLFKRLMG